MRATQVRAYYFLMVSLERNVLGFKQIVHVRGYISSGQVTIFYREMNFFFFFCPSRILVPSGYSLSDQTQSWVGVCQSIIKHSLPLGSTAFTTPGYSSPL